MQDAVGQISEPHTERIYERASRRYLRNSVGLKR